MRGTSSRIKQILRIVSGLGCERKGLRLFQRFALSKAFNDGFNNGHEI